MKLLSSLPNVDPATANQDVGVAKDDIIPGDGNGTPVREDWQNDLYYGFRAILNLAGLTPDNSVEGVTQSQVANAIQAVANGITLQRKNVNTNYTILDNDFYRVIYVDTTSADVTITLPLLANNYGRKIRIFHARGGTNKVIIIPNASDSNTLTNDGLAAIWLPSVGNYIDFEANDSTSALLWQAVDERVTSHLRLDTYAGYGSTDTKIARFTNATTNIGNMFSENHSTGYNSNTEGLEITINRSGNYSFDLSTNSTITIYFGFTINSPNLTTNINSIGTPSEVLNLSSGGSNNWAVSWSGKLNKNDIIRVHTNGGVANVAALWHFTATYLGS